MTTPAPDCVAVLRHDREFRVVAMRACVPGETLLTFNGVLVDRPSQTSVQVDVAKHLAVPPGVTLQQLLDEHAWRFLNHSCHANAALRGRDLVALRGVAPWDEITFDYNTTEYEMMAPFRCVCGANGCSGSEVRGFRFLSEEAREALRPILTPHLLRWWEAQRAG